MKNNGNDTEKIEKISSPKSLQIGNDEILQSALQASSKMFEQEEDQLENSLIGHSQRLMNVAHSLVEERENNYLEGKNENNTRIVDIGTLEAVCKLSSEARENMRLVLDWKKAKTNAIKTVAEAIRGR